MNITKSTDIGTQACRCTFHFKFHFRGLCPNTYVTRVINGIIPIVTVFKLYIRCIFSVQRIRHTQQLTDPRNGIICPAFGVGLNLQKIRTVGPVNG